MHFFLFIFFTFLFCYFVLKKTQFHHTKHFNFNSSHFYYISIHKNHKLYTILFCYFQSHKIHFQKFKKNTNLHKFIQNAHFTPISFPSPQFVHLESSSPITPHHYPIKHHSPPKIIQKSHKNSFFTKSSKLPFLTPHLT